MAEPNPHHVKPSPIDLSFTRATNERIPYFNIGYTVAADGSTVDLEVINASGADFITVKFTDKQNNSKSHTFKPVATGDGFTLDTSALRSDCAWEMRVYGAELGTSAGCDSTKEDYISKLCAPLGASGDTVPSGLQGIWPTITDDGSTQVTWLDNKIIQYEEVFNLTTGGDQNVGDDLKILIDLNASSEVPVTFPVGYAIYAASITGDVITSVSNPFPQFPPSQQVLEVELDNTTVGTKSAIVELVTSDNAYPNYEFTLTWTVV